MEFEWDLSKEMENLQKHGIGFMEAIETFSDPDGFQLRDTKHSTVETRFFWIGKTQPERLLRRGLHGVGIVSEFLGRHQGENSRGSIMKEPRLSDLEIDKNGTRQIKRGMASAKAVKITINIDKESLLILRDKAAKTGVPYQRLLNRILKKALQEDRDTDSRLARLEREVSRLKKKIVA